MALNAPKAILSKLVIPQEQPSRWRWTYALELQVWSGGSAEQSAGSAAATGGPTSASNWVVNLPINPESMRVSSPLAHRVTYTAGGVSVDEGGFREQNIVVTGTAGLQAKRGWSVGVLGSDGRPTGGGMVFQDGNHLWRELRQVFRVYSAMVQNPQPGVLPRLIWHDWRNDDHWVVVPTDWDMDRRASQHRMHYPFSFALKAVADADRPTPTLLMQIQDAAAQIVAVINEVAGYVDDLNSLVREFNVTVQSALLGVIGAARNVVAAADGIKQGIRDTMNIPKVVAESAQRLIDDLVSLLDDDLGNDPWSPTSPTSGAAHARYETVQALGDAMSSVTGQREGWERSWSDENDRQRRQGEGERLLTTEEVSLSSSSGLIDGGVGPGMTSRASPGSSQRRTAQARRSTLNPDSPSRYTGQRPYAVRPGDTLPAIAHREMGDASAWYDLATLNGLKYPFISPAKLPGTVWVGEILMVPIPAGSTTISMGNGPRLDEQSEIDLMGVDIYMNSLGEWEIDPATDDLRKASGVDAYMQGLDVKVRTEIGQNAVWPGLGIMAPIGAPNSTGTADAIALSVRRVVLSDPRTESIEKPTVVDLGDGASVEMTVIPRGARTGRVLRRAVE